eukprot:jgi/Botrbrau1/3045/Bobra.0070s0041.1
MDGVKDVEGSVWPVGRASDAGEAQTLVRPCYFRRKYKRVLHGREGLMAHCAVRQIQSGGAWHGKLRTTNARLAQSSEGRSMSQSVHPLVSWAVTLRDALIGTWIVLLNSRPDGRLWSVIS